MYGGMIYSLSDKTHKKEKIICEFITAEYYHSYGVCVCVYGRLLKLTAERVRILKVVQRFIYENFKFFRMW